MPLCCESSEATMLELWGFGGGHSRLVGRYSQQWRGVSRVSVSIPLTRDHPQHPNVQLPLRAGAVLYFINAGFPGFDNCSSSWRSAIAEGGSKVLAV